MSRNALTLSFVLILAAIVGEARAAINLTAPAGLNPGDQFRFAFVTNDGIRGWNNDIAIYDEFVNTAANSVGLQYNNQPLQWKALVSALNSSSVLISAIDRLPATSPGLYLMDGTLLASNGADLWDGSINQPFDLAENLQPLANVGFVWTGTKFDGSSQVRLGAFQPTFGRTDSQTATWVAAGETIWDATFHVYAFSEILTVASTSPVPEPASLALWSITAVGCAVSFYRRRSVA